jgi:hypothetical protein
MVKWWQLFDINNFRMQESRGSTVDEGYGRKTGEEHCGSGGGG